ncbi:MAG: PD-(D/E)XK nuclease family protein [Candidatus Hydrothermarchaeaceae archaeon]
MPTYSHSRLSTYENCPLQYKFRYVDRVKLEDEWGSIEAFMGSRVHDTLEKLYHDLGLSKLNTSEELLSFYDDIWENEWSGDIRIVKKGYTAENYRDTGKKCIADYYERYSPFNDSRTLGLEQRVMIDVGEHRLTGYIDRLSQGGEGNYEIHDYKTGQHLPLQEYFDSDRQLALYQIGVEEMWGDAKSVDLVWHYLAHDREIRSRRTKEEIEQLKSDIVSLIGDVERAGKENDFPARESGLCSWCEYQELCPNHAHVAKTSAMPANEFLNEPGVKLVNRYAGLIQEKKAYLDDAESEIEKLKEAIIAYAEKEGVEVIRGSEKKLKVKTEARAKFPGKGDAGRAELDDLLKKGRKWQKVSDLNVHVLAKAMKSGAWSPGLVKKIEKYRRVEEGYRLTLSALKDRKG